ncbi:gamma-glutamyltransferase family protein [Sulfurospirillum arcachonense]|uniref:gamma-glutamyltransferase family protein n=1 Tax=Sulfurospirillum arcachonense TaxID=57666 RepID=UPI00046AF9CC|nr:gamma-glutamyltransferase [Sulfurospirillum arcachonense]
MNNIKGVVSAGDENTAKAGEWILRQGGNAYDAALACMLAAPICEPIFTSLGGGGFMQCCEVGKTPHIYDFFVDVPKKRIDEPEFFPIYVDFKTTIQEFHIGCGSAAIPGMVKGIWQIYLDHASLPMETLIQPAKKYATDGIYLSQRQASFVKLLTPIFTSTKSSMDLYSHNGQLIDETILFKNPQYANFLEEFAQKGADIFYNGTIAQNIDTLCKNNDGLITKEALQTYEVKKREPIHFKYKDYDVYTNPPPSSGGILIAFSLMLLENQNLNSNYLEKLIEAQKITGDFRREHVDEFIHKNHLEEILSHEKLIKNFNLSMNSRLNMWGNTTHISVIDKDGNTASVTTTNGEACGHVIPETGIMLNNMLGEEDLNPHGFFSWPSGIRLPSMMAPTALMKNGKPELILGSAGSNRIRSAVLQTILNYTHFKMTPQEAISAPRIHYERGEIYCEPSLHVKMNETIKKEYKLNEFDELNLFFGGVQAVSRKFKGGADPRRGASVINLC